MKLEIKRTPTTGMQIKINDEFVGKLNYSENSEKFISLLEQAVGLVNGVCVLDETVLNLPVVSGSLPTDADIETKFPIDNKWAIEDRTHAIGKRQGAKWMRDKISRL